MRFERRVVAGARTPVLLAGPVDLQRLGARVADLASLLAEAAELARRGLPIALTEDEAFALAIVSGEPTLVRQLLEVPRVSPTVADSRNRSQRASDGGSPEPVG